MSMTTRGRDEDEDERDPGVREVPRVTVRHTSILAGAHTANIQLDAVI